MRLSKITRKQVVDILVRTAKTFIAAGLGAITTLGPSDIKTWIITFGSAGATAVLNLIIKAFTEEED